MSPASTQSHPTPAATPASRACQSRMLQLLDSLLIHPLRYSGPNCTLGLRRDRVGRAYPRYGLGVFRSTTRASEAQCSQPGGKDTTRGMLQAFLV